MLGRGNSKHGVYYGCSTCHGRLVGLGVLRKSIDREAVNFVWRTARDGLGIPSRTCPICAVAMSEVSVRAEPLDVDVCTRCHMVWFDGGELDAMPIISGPPPPPELSPQAKAAIALNKIDHIREQAEEYGMEARAPDSMWKMIPGLLYLPVEMDSRSLSRWPLVTWGFAALALLFFLMTMDGLSQAIERWGFIPANPLRAGGMTMIFSALLHGGWAHLLGNLYFLLIFGDDVEEYLGTAKMTLLMAVAAMCGCLFHYVVYSDSHVPLIGASGAISGVICFYSLLHPHARIGMLVRYYMHGGWINFSARTAFLLWMLWQFAGTWMQLKGFSNVSALGHLGGVLAGILAWAAWRDQ